MLIAALAAVAFAIGFGKYARSQDGGSPIADVPDTESGGRTRLGGFDEVAVTISDGSGKTCEVCLLAARTGTQRGRGLMEVTDPDLGGYDGMLFEYPTAVDGAFWMRNTPMPLSIAFFDTDRTLVSMTDMEPCADKASCRTYPADRPFQYALEVPQGRLAELLVAEGSTFTIDGRRCPALATAPS